MSWHDGFSEYLKELATFQKKMSISIPNIFNNYQNFIYVTVGSLTVKKRR
jgi:hypothetical protein